MISNSLHLNPVITLYRVSCTIMIVLCHIISYYTFIPGYSVLPQVFNVGVSAFFFISGYLYGGKQIHNFRRWFQQRIIKLWLPLQILVITDIAVLSVFFHTRVNVKSIVTHFFNLQGLYFIDAGHLSRFLLGIANLGPLWFLSILMMCYFLLPSLQHIKPQIASHPQRSVLILLLFGLICVLLKYFSGIVLSYFLTFGLGYFFSSSNYLNHPNRKMISLFLMVTSVSVQFGRLFLHVKYDDTPLYLSYTSVSHILLALFGFLLVSEAYTYFPTFIDRLASLHVVEYLNQMSLYIYMTHGIFCSGVTNLYTRTSIVPASICFVLCTLIASHLLKSLTALAARKVQSHT